MHQRRKRRIYLAAAFRHQQLMRDLRERLTQLGYEVLGAWLDEDSSTEGKLSRTDSNHVADRCIYEVIKASIFLCYIDPKDSSRGGHHVEFGYAWGKGKVLVSVGSAERNVFHEIWKVHQFTTIGEFLQSAVLWKNYLPPRLSSP
jgi:nucleoside 2-deoxyribosyltransferase